MSLVNIFAKANTSQEAPSSTSGSSSLLEEHIQFLVGKKLIEDSNNLKFDELKTICNKIARNLETEIPFKN